MMRRRAGRSLKFGMRTMLVAVALTALMLVIGIPMFKASLCRKLGLEPRKAAHEWRLELPRGFSNPAVGAVTPNVREVIAEQPFNPMVLKRLRKLESLRITSDLASEEFPQLPQVKNLSFKRNGSARETDCSVVQYFPNLVYLRLPLPCENFEHVGTLTELKNLSLRLSETMDISALGACKKLECLDLGRCDGAMFMDLNVDLSSLAKLANLKSIEIHNLSGQEFPNLPQVRLMSLYSGNNRTDCRVLRSFQNLTELYLDFAPGSRNLGEVANLEHLEELEIALDVLPPGGNLSNTDLPFITKLPALKRLTLSSLDAAPDLSALEGCGQLESLTLGLETLSGIDLSPLLQLPKLEDVTVDCRNDRFINRSLGLSDEEKALMKFKVDLDPHGRCEDGYADGYADGYSDGYAADPE